MTLSHLCENSKIFIRGKVYMKLPEEQKYWYGSCKNTCKYFEKGLKIQKL